MIVARNNFLITFPSFLIALLPLFLITGPFLSDLSVFTVSIFFLINVVKNKDFGQFDNNFFKIFIFFFLYLVFNSLIKFYDIHNIRVSFFYLRFGLYVLAVIYFLNKNEKLIKYLFFCFLFCFICLLVDGFYQYFFEVNLTGFSLGHERRISSFFYDDYILGSYLSRLSPIFLGLSILIFKNNKKNLILIFILLILIQTLIFLTGERASFFFSLLTILFLILMMQRYRLARLLALILPIIMIISISIFNDSAKKRIIDETMSQIGIHNEKKYIFSEHHESHYKSAYLMFSENKIFGIGLRNFRNFCKEERFQTGDRSCSTHPHNTYIQLLSETGIIGFLFSLYVFLYFSFKIIYHLKEKFFKKRGFFNDFEICILSAILITIWPLTPNGNFFNNWLSIVYYFPIGFLLWSFRKR